ncbi:hypothetical protein GMORB2_2865 [Geosmithia morbida]|uniref:Uncharacterized protein n=1 Tax=Geosmithia morbida TaxID=1094350 RepID=A0A9P4YPR0_9HYPO|nr:uncharacterized protein GMORB2_2865 [Geosmithia morbida]KAF4120861.1 hypothetical protein GMORB2_2865 [Geosmithia morbida]
MKAELLSIMDDIKVMTGCSDHDLDDRLDFASQSGGQLAAVLDRMRLSTREKPHVLVAYVYILYMAPFAGGRVRLFGQWEPRLTTAQRDDIVDGAVAIFDGMDGLVCELKWRVPSLHKLTEDSRREPVRDCKHGEPMNEDTELATGQCPFMAASHHPPQHRETAWAVSVGLLVVLAALIHCIFLTVQNREPARDYDLFTWMY